MSLDVLVNAGEQTPTAEVSVDVGVEHALGSWSVKREIASDLPAQVTGARGRAVAECDVTLTAPENAGPGHFSPWRNPARRIKAPITLDVGLSGEHERVFTGQVLDDGGAADHTGVAPLALECEDNLGTLRKKVSLPGIGARMSDAGGDVYQPGISPGWAIDTILRQHGYYTTPPPEAGCRVSIPCQDSMWPELPVISDPGTVWAYSPSGAPTFTSTDFGRAAVDCAHYVEITSGIAFTVGSTLRIAAITDTGSAYAAVVLNGGAGWSELALEILSDGTAELTSRASSSSGTPVSVPHEAGPIVADLTRTSTTAISYTVTSTVGGAPTVSTGTMTVDAALLLDIRGPIDTAWVQSDGVPIAGVQVATNIAAPSTTLAHVKGTDLDPSLGAILAVPPGIDGVGVEVLTDIAAAEFGALWMGETGLPTFRNRDSLRGIGATPEEITSHDKLLSGMAWTRDTSSLRSAVEMPVNPPRVRTATNETIVVWESDSTVEVPANGSLDFIVDALGNVGALDGTVTGVDGGDAAPNPSTGSYYRNVSPGGVYAPVCQVSASLVGPSRIRIRIRNTAGYAVSLTRVDGTPALVIRARTLITQDDDAAIIVRAENPDLIADGLADELSLPANPWQQDIATVTEDVRWIASLCSDPIPVLQTVRVVFDPRRRLGDVCVLVDPSVTGLRAKVLVTGISMAGSAGTATQELTVRLLPWTVDEVDAAYAGMTVDEFDAYWAGFTVDDFDLMPLGRPDAPL